MRQFHLGVKSDPILYRYSYAWLFKLMAEEGAKHLQLGTFFELYQLPDSFFKRLRAEATDHGITISSVFTAHRELGGYFQGGEWVGVARKNHQRLIEIASLLGARSAGHNPGAVLRDRMETKQAGWDCYINHFTELMHLAHQRGVPELTIEPMSCEAEPPTSPEDQCRMMEELTSYHAAHADTAIPGYCIDIAHGWAGSDRAIKVDHWGLLAAGLPWCREVHLKNTDVMYDKTFGFSDEDRQVGIIDVAACRSWLEQRDDMLPVQELVGYLEIGGPKLGRDYSDSGLEDMLRESLRHLQATWVGAVNHVEKYSVHADPAVVRVLPSIMCADQCHLADAVRALEAAGCEMLHFDVMDGAFTPNLVLGFEQLKHLRRCTTLPIDVHLMVENNDLFVQLAKDASADRVSVHVESCRHLDRTLTNIRTLGMKAGVALNPHTPVETLEFILDRLDFVLVMTVNPGFAGQQLVPSAIAKIAAVKQFLSQHDRNIPIAVDGNVSFQHIPNMVAAGADELICGSSSIFAAGSALTDNVRRTRAAAAEGVRRRSTAPVINGDRHTDDARLQLTAYT